MWKRRTHAGESRIKNQWDTWDSSNIYIFSYILSFTLLHLCFWMLQSNFYIFSPFHLTHFFQLLVPHCSLLSLLPSNILLTHNCGTLSPVLPINPHHRHLGPLSRLSVNVHSKVSKSGPFQQRVPGRFSQAMRPTVEHAFLLYRVYRADRTSSTPPL